MSDQGLHYLPYILVGPYFYNEVMYTYNTYYLFIYYKTIYTEMIWYFMKEILYLLNCSYYIYWTVPIIFTELVQISKLFLSPIV